MNIFQFMYEYSGYINVTNSVCASETHEMKRKPNNNSITIPESQN